MHPASPGTPADLPPALVHALALRAAAKSVDPFGALDFADAVARLREIADARRKAAEAAPADAVRMADVLDADFVADASDFTAVWIGRDPVPGVRAAALTLAALRDARDIYLRKARRAAADLDVNAVGRQAFEAFGSDIGPNVAEVDAASLGETWGTPSDRWASVYRVAVLDGGPEEGGWTWDRRELVASVQLCPDAAAAWLAVSCDGLAALPEAARLVLAAAVDAHGLTLPGSTSTPDGRTRPLRPPHSASPEVDAAIYVEPYPGANARRTRPVYE